MTRISRNIAVLVSALVVAVFLGGISAGQAEFPAGSAGLKREVLVEAIVVQVGADALARLRIGPNMEPLSEIKVSLPMLLYVLADPNAAKTITSAKMKVWAGETGEVKNGQNIKYLIKTDEGSFEQRVTDTFFGTIFEATPVIDEEGDILLSFKFEHLEAVPPEEVDPQTSLPIGEPIQVAATTLISRVKIKSGEPMIAGRMEMTASEPQQFVLVRAEY